MAKDMNPEFIKGNEREDINLIPVHINKARTNEYYYSWSSDMKGWVRTGKIPEDLKRLYNNPPTKSNYK